MRRGAKPAKAKVEAKLPVARKSRENEGSRVRDLEERLAGALKREAEGLEQQTATAEILRVISSTPTDVQPVFDAVAEAAARLCEAFDAAIFRRENDRLRLVAHHGPIPLGPIGEFTVPLGRGTGPGRSVVDGRTIHVTDLQAEVDEFPEGSQLARQFGFRTTLNVPLMREGVAIGTITLRRTEAQLFTAPQVALLKTFADQAVIAIENVRLFTELQARNADLTDALARETATSEILRVISRSPTDVQPVLAAIVRSAVRLCGGTISTLYRYDGHLIHLEVTSHPSGVPPAITQGQFPRPADTSSLIGRAIVERAVVNVADMETDPRAHPGIGRVAARERGFRSMVIVPMFRENQTVGGFTVGRAEPGEFSDTDIALLQTFADQAVIAIENVRLFKELDARNRDLAEALTQQTTTSEILRVIAGSPTDLQPVLDALVESASRLCQAADTFLLLVEGDQLRVAALHGSVEESARLSNAIHRGWMAGRAVVDARTVHVEDLTKAEAEFPLGAQIAVRLGHRTALALPLLRKGVPIGALFLRRREVRQFSDKEIALLQTFADQAVIAIENVRLFEELEARNKALTEALEQQTATAEILRTISQAQTDAQPVFEAIADSVMRLFGAWSALVFGYDGEFLRLTAARGGLPGSSDSLLARLGVPYRPTDDSPALRTVRTRTVQHIVNVEALDPSWNPRFQEEATARGFRSLVQAPMLREDDVVGVIAVTRAQPGGFTPAEIALLKTFADQAVIAIENVRLFTELQTRNREIADKSRQLEVASQHKSEFLANMSHELRTPLNAIIGFSEVLSERMFGELNEKQAEYLKDIYASGTHLLSLINDILDLSKIEAGRMELELTDFDLPTAIDSALTLIRERAGRRGITLHTAVDQARGQVRADERKIRQVVLNLLSNAIKFTPEGGRIEVRAEPRDGFV
jgi:two-component system, NtrC family, sensor kinase